MDDEHVSDQEDDGKHHLQQRHRDVGDCAPKLSTHRRRDGDDDARDGFDGVADRHPGREYQPARQVDREGHQQGAGEDQEEQAHRLTRARVVGVLLHRPVIAVAGRDRVFDAVFGLVVRVDQVQRCPRAGKNVTDLLLHLVHDPWPVRGCGVSLVEFLDALAVVVRRIEDDTEVDQLGGLAQEGIYEGRFDGVDLLIGVAAGVPTVGQSRRDFESGIACSENQTVVTDDPVERVGEKSDGRGRDDTRHEQFVDASGEAPAYEPHGHAESGDCQHQWGERELVGDRSDGVCDGADRRENHFDPVEGQRVSDEPDRRRHHESEDLVFEGDDVRPDHSPTAAH